MANLEEFQQKDVELDLSNVPRGQRTAVKEAVGNFIVDQILSNVAGGKSPVTGDAFLTLNEAYADREKGGDRNPNLELEGDLLASLGFKNTKDGVAVGIMSAKQRPKADGHNNFSGDSKLPERRFIAAADQDFVPEIMNEVSQIISEFEGEPDPDQELTLQRAPQVTGFSVTPVTIKEGIGITLSDLIFDEDIITKLFRKIK